MKKAVVWIVGLLMVASLSLTGASPAQAAGDGINPDHWAIKAKNSARDPLLRTNTGRKLTLTNTTWFKGPPGPERFVQIYRCNNCEIFIYKYSRSTSNHKGELLERRKGSFNGWINTSEKVRNEYEIIITYLIYS